MTTPNDPSGKSKADLISEQTETVRKRNALQSMRDLLDQVLYHNTQATMHLREYDRLTKLYEATRKINEEAGIVLPEEATISDAVPEVQTESQTL